MRYPDVLTLYMDTFKGPQTLREPYTLKSLLQSRPAAEAAKHQTLSTLRTREVPDVPRVCAGVGGAH
jgi:hypothetical protein